MELFGDIQITHGPMESRVMSRRSGFTIVELLIVIVVIAILAAITVVSYNGIQQRAKVTRANTDLKVLEKAILAARINENKTLITITGTGCTICGGAARMSTTLDILSTASGMNLNALKAGDPWGNPYRIDENEGENGLCNRDTLTMLDPPSGIMTPVITTYAC